MSAGLRIAFTDGRGRLLAHETKRETMTASTLNATIEKQARRLAQEALRTDPSIVKFYWFPADDEVRLIEVATDMPPSLSTEVEPFYFPPAPKHDMPAPSGVALIRLDEDRKLTLPSGWGDWDAAVELEPEAGE